MRKCPYCQDTQQQIKVGFTPAGSQRFKCKLCQRTYTPQPKQMYSDEMRRFAIRCYADGASYRWAARYLGVDHVTVMNWVKAYVDQLPPAPVPTETPLHIVEMDGLHTFVGDKKQMVHNHNG